MATLIIANIGGILVIFAGQIILVAVHLILCMLSLLLPKTSALRQKLGYYLYWNGTIRIFMEGYIDICLFAMLNIKEIFWNEDIQIVTISNWISIVMLGLCVLMPIVLLLFLLCKRKVWDSDDF